MRANMKTIAIVAALGLGLGSLAQAEGIRVKGSDTMVHLVSAWAEKFMAANPSIEVTVTGGGSGTGIAALINGTTEIATASRTMKDSEINQAKGRGFIPIEHVVARDGLSVIVNPANPVKTLTMEQVKKIFTGEVSNWKVFGGDDQRILVFTRDSSSGTFVFFQEDVLKKMDYSVKARRLASNSALVQSVSEDVNAIAYVGLGYLTEAKGKVKAVGIKKNEKSEVVMPSVETVTAGTYAISRGLQIYTKGEPSGAVKTFVDFVKGDEGQSIVESMGFVKK